MLGKQRDNRLRIVGIQPVPASDAMQMHTAIGVMRTLNPRARLLAQRVRLLRLDGTLTQDCVAHRYNLAQLLLNTTVLLGCGFG